MQQKIQETVSNPTACFEWNELMVATQEYHEPEDVIDTLIGCRGLACNRHRMLEAVTCTHELYKHLSNH